MAKLTEYAKCAVCQFCHYWWFSFLGPTARIGGYSRIFHWPPYVGGPMRTILPVSFSFDMYFFIVVVDFERVFDIFLDEIFGFSSTPASWQLSAILRKSDLITSLCVKFVAY